jgi:hypothetical protein
MTRWCPTPRGTGPAIAKPGARGMVIPYAS